MTTDASRRVGVLLLAVAGACFAVGVPGLVNPAWATHAAAWLFMVGAGLPLLLLAWVEQREKSAVAGVQLRLDEARAWANELSNREREARLAAPAPTPIDSKLSAKSLAVETFFRAGEKAGGFSEGKLAGCVGSDHGPWLRHFYISPAGGEWLRDAGGKVGTVWNFERDLDGVLRALRAGEMPLPPGPVPDVKPLPDSAAQRKTPQKSAARVIQGN